MSYTIDDSQSHEGRLINSWAAFCSILLKQRIHQLIECF